MVIQLILSFLLAANCKNLIIYIVTATWYTLHVSFVYNIADISWTQMTPYPICGYCYELVLCWINFLYFDAWHGCDTNVMT